MRAPPRPTPPRPGPRPTRTAAPPNRPTPTSIPSSFRAAPGRYRTTSRPAHAPCSPSPVCPVYRVGRAWLLLPRLPVLPYPTRLPRWPRPQPTWITQATGPVTPPLVAPSPPFPEHGPYLM